MSAPRTESGNTERVSARVVSIDALRGVVMLVMIFVNDLGDVPGDVVPAWMKHFRGPDGMTFVDLVFPAFLFMVGMSIPFALTSRMKREPLWRTALHVLLRTLSLLFIGIMMVNGTPDTQQMGWSGPLWEVLMFFAAICAFCDFAPAKSPAKAGEIRRNISFALRVVGWMALIYLAFAFRNHKGKPMLTLSPFYIHHIWYGILGYIGWAYLLSAAVFLVFRTNLLAILGCVVLMMCLYPAAQLHLFAGLWIANHINIGVALGTRAAIAALGLLFGAMLAMPEKRSAKQRVQFTLLLAAGCAAAALLLHPLYGISKDNGTPSWALWGCVVTAVAWLPFYFVADVRPVQFIARPLALMGANVLLAYLISEMWPSVREVIGLDGPYDAFGQASLTHAIIRSTVCAVAILSLATGLNRIGFRLRL